MGLLLDDNAHIFPALLGNYGQYIASYFRGYGFFRPLALPFLGLVYNLYLFSPVLSHLFVFFIHFFTGFLLGKSFEKSFGKKNSFLISILYITFPFFTEQYGWLAASNSLMTNLFLIMQIYFIQRNNLKTWLKLFLLFLFQIFGVMFYESAFFVFFPIGLLLANSKKKPFRNGLAYSLLLSIPSILYFFLRSFIFLPQNEQTVRNIGLAEFMSGKWFYIFVNNLGRLFTDITFLFSSQGSRVYFWSETISQGVNYLINNLFLVLSFGLFLIFILIPKNESEKSTKKTEVYIFLISIFTLIPALLVNTPSFPFRVITIPLFFLLVCIVTLINKLNSKIFFLLTFSIILFNSIISQQMIHKMINQSNDDKNMAASIVTYLDGHLEKGKKTVLIVNDIPHSTQTEFTYGEYLGSCFTADWCLTPLINKYTDKVSRVYINSLTNDKNGKFVEFVYDKTKHKLIINKEKL